MPVGLDQFVKNLTDSGVLSAGKLEHFLPPKAAPKSAEELAKELVRQKQLTKYQAAEIYQGRAKSLILGNYTILDKIGAGGMGQVFKAEHRRMHRVVALKVLPKAVTKDAAAVARFQREVEAAARLNHPNIVTAHDADEAAGVNFLVMEFVEGTDLSALVKKDGPLALDKALQCILQAARGLEFAHGEGVVHRDIKPANLLLDKKGTVKILDMGLARIEAGGDAATQAELTGTGAVMGTVDYMSPEQALNTKHADARADIYSLGCALHYLLTGKPVYDGDTLTAKLIAHQVQPVPELRKICAGVSAELEAVFQKMVAKKVEDRYQTMSQVVADLQACISRESTVVGAAMTTDTNVENSGFSFLKDATAHAHQRKALKATKSSQADVRSTGSADGGRRRKLLLIGGGLIAALVVFAGVIFKLRSNEGTLVVESDRPDAVVEALSEAVKPVHRWPADAVSFGSKRFRLYKQDLDWKAAIKTCTDLGGRLAEVRSQEENNFLVQLAVDSGIDGVWLGATDELEEGHWLWGDGSPLVYSNWDTGQPNDFGDGGEDYLMLLASFHGGTWWDQPSASGRGLPEHWKTGYICEWDDPGQAAVGVSQKPWNSAAFQKWENKVASLPAEEQVKAVSEKLQELNPGYDENLSENGRFRIEGGVVVELQARGNRLKDLSPFRALKGLAILDMRSREPNGQAELTDLSPLQGLSLKVLSVSDAKVSDLSPLTRMPLEQLILLNTKVANLAPLRGMPLAYLGFQNAPVADLSPIRGMPIIWLDCAGSQVTDLSPLKGMQIKFLMCHATKVADLSPLEGMPLTELWCTATPVSDLWPLKGMPLKALQLNVTQVSDLSPLKGMPLATLYCANTQVTDLSPLAGMRLTTFGFTPKNIAQGIDIVRQMQSVKSLYANDDKNQWREWPPDEFWKKYDAGDFGKPDSVGTTPAGNRITTYNDPAFQKWMQDVAALPAEEQVKAVSKKLVELNPGFNGKCGDKIEGGVVPELAIITDNVADLSPVRALGELRVLTAAASNWGKGMLNDLSPLNGMKLTSFDCSANKVSNLSPLVGMPLTSLSLRGNPEMSDLSPLKGMKLTELYCANTNVSDLSPLKGMKLTTLCCEHTPVSDLTPVEGMPLMKLEIHDTLISDLSAIRGMKLTQLIGYHTQISDLSPLQWMALTELNCDGTQISDLLPISSMQTLSALYARGTKVTPAGVAALQKNLPNCKIAWDDPTKVAANQPNRPWNTPAFRSWMKKVSALPAEDQIKSVVKKLQELNPGFDGNVTGFNLKTTPTIVDGTVTELGFLTDNVTDLGPVRALVGLKNLDCRGKGADKGQLSDLSPLKGMQLTGLICGGTRVADLSPLKGMPLTFMNCGGTAVSDLSPLSGMRLTYLHCDATRVSDLSLLRGMPLSELLCNDTQVSDLSVLNGIELETIGFTPKNISRGIEVIRQMKTLKTVGLAHNIQFSPNEFWSKYDAGDFK